MSSVMVVKSVAFISAVVTGTQLLSEATDPPRVEGAGAAARLGVAGAGAGTRIVVAGAGAGTRTDTGAGAGARTVLCPKTPSGAAAKSRALVRNDFIVR